MEAKQTTRPAQSLDQESDQGGDTERINKREETTDDVPWENHECYDTIGGETISHAEPIGPDV